MQTTKIDYYHKYKSEPKILHKLKSYNLNLK